jgi:multicomponent Na+:H+ antiporter subunit D
MTIGGLTMFIGVMGAFSQYTFRRILSFHIVSQIGYMVFALAIYTPMGIAFGIFFIVHNMLVKSSLLFVGDCVLLNEGSEDLKKVSGLIKDYPWLAVIFLFAALSLVGIPPLSGFYGKFGLVLEGFREGHHLFAAVAILTGLFTMASMVKIWNYAFWGDRPAKAGPPGRKNGLIVATGGLVAASIVLALGSGFFIRIMSVSGTDLLDRRPYIGAVLGERGLAQLDAQPLEVTMP